MASSPDPRLRPQAPGRDLFCDLRMQLQQSSASNSGPVPTTININTTVSIRGPVRTVLLRQYLNSAESSAICRVFPNVGHPLATHNPQIAAADFLLRHRAPGPKMTNNNMSPGSVHAGPSNQADESRSEESTEPKARKACSQ
ncbi:hypothetical protein PG985_016078 [Apiospora marii]|uniref:Uncharacterized protein n=1 Tax=Apiospora marii TaxID=335849 RepID=A0ABR1S3T8_9PEZI